MNAILGTVQHKKAEKSLNSLKSLSSPNAKVIRDGVKMEISSIDVVPGDIESALTGESTNVDKQDIDITNEAPLGDRITLMFAVALAVAAIPEALSSIVTIVQAMGTHLFR